MGHGIWLCLPSPIRQDGGRASMARRVAGQARAAAGLGRQCPGHRVLTATRPGRARWLSQPSNRPVQRPPFENTTRLDGPAQGAADRRRLGRRDPTGVMMRVFISHSSQDKPQVEALALALDERGIDPWLDKWEIGPGDDIVASINTGLEEAPAGIIVFSSHTRGSRWVEAEVSYLTFARNVEGKVLIPVMLGKDAWVPPLLRPLARRGIDEIDAIVDALQGRRGGPPRARRPEGGRIELVSISLRPGRAGSGAGAGSGVEVELSIGNEIHASAAHASIPHALLRVQGTLLNGTVAGHRRDPVAAERAVLEGSLVELGRHLRSFCLPEPSGQALADLLDGCPVGTTVEVRVEAEGPELLGLPFEALRLPDDRLLAIQPACVLWRRPIGLPTSASEALAALKVLVAVGCARRGRKRAPPSSTMSASSRTFSMRSSHCPGTRMLRCASWRWATRRRSPGRSSATPTMCSTSRATAVRGRWSWKTRTGKRSRPRRGRADRAAQGDRASGPFGLPQHLPRGCSGRPHRQFRRSAPACRRAGGPRHADIGQRSLREAHSPAPSTSIWPAASICSRAGRSPTPAGFWNESGAPRSSAANRSTRPSPSMPRQHFSWRGTSSRWRTSRSTRCRSGYARCTKAAGPVPQLRLDDLIGRRKELRECLRALRDGRAEWSAVWCSPESAAWARARLRAG